MAAIACAAIEEITDLRRRLRISEAEHRVDNQTNAELAERECGFRQKIEEAIESLAPAVLGQDELFASIKRGLRAALAEVFGPIEEAPSLEVEITLFDGEDPFITAVRGQIEVSELAEIEAALQPEIDDYYKCGAGVYLVRPEYFPGQDDGEGRWEITPSWGTDPAQIVFLRPIPPPFESAIVDGAPAECDGSWRVSDHEWINEACVECGVRMTDLVPDETISS